MKKRILTLIAAAILMITATASLVSCNKPSVKDDVAVSTLVDAAKEKIPSPLGYITADADFVEFNFENMPTAKDFSIFMATNTSSNLNEVGIFHFGTPEEAASADESIKAYLKAKDESFKNSINYTPDEYPKIENATTKVVGNYVVYTVLTEEDSASVIGAVEALLVE